ncbi:MAG TPA: hypothetical protein VIH29_06060 [Gallionella sp.]
MGGIFYLMGVALAGYAGYSGFQWYFIFISSLVMALGYFIIRAPQIHGLVSSDGIVVIPKLLSIQVIWFSIITAPVYFAASALD